VLDLLASGRLDLAPLVTHEFDFDNVDAAYELVDGRAEPMLGVRLAYELPTNAAGPTRVSQERPPSEWIDRRGPGIAFIGAGSFARGVLLPAMKEAGFTDFVGVASATGVSAERLARDGGFRKGALSIDEILADPDVGVVVITTTHEHHAGLAARALRAGCHVFCEKPLALSVEELAGVQDASGQSGRVLLVGFNRRFSPAIRDVKDRLSGRGPIHINYRVNAGPIEPKHWYADRRQGGRLLGEVCHFIDTCLALVDSPISHVSAVASSEGEADMATDFGLALEFGDGSLATIAYASGGSPRTPKERIEILGGGHTVLIDDFRSVVIDEKVLWSGTQDKGHVALVREFFERIENPNSTTHLETSLSTSRVVLEVDKAIRG
jgi:hypothetical protein